MALLATVQHSPVAHPLFARPLFSRRPNQDPLKAYAIENNAACVYGGEPLTWDNISYEHIIPKEKGGPNSVFNYLLACVGCNNKRSKIPLPTFFKRSLLSTHDGLNKITNNLINQLTAMKNCVISGLRYYDGVLPTVADGLGIKEEILEKAVDQHSPELLFEALPVKWF